TAGRTGAADDPQRAAAEMTEHLPRAAGRVTLAPEAMQQHVERRLSQRHAQRQVTVVWHHIIAPGVHRERTAELRGFVAGRRNHEVYFALAAELPQPVVFGSRQHHAAQDARQALAGKAKSLVRSLGA